MSFSKPAQKILVRLAPKYFWFEIKTFKTTFFCMDYYFDGIACMDDAEFAGTLVVVKEEGEREERRIAEDDETMKRFYAIVFSDEVLEFDDKEDDDSEQQARPQKVSFARPPLPPKPKQPRGQAVMVRRDELVQALFEIKKETR
jgi:hypothetical protein